MYFKLSSCFSLHAGTSSWFSGFRCSVISCIILFLSSCVIFALDFPSLSSSRSFSVHTCVSWVNQSQVSSLIVFLFSPSVCHLFSSWCRLVGSSCVCICSSRVLFFAVFCQIFLRLHFDYWIPAFLNKSRLFVSWPACLCPRLFTHPADTKRR